MLWGCANGTVSEIFVKSYYAENHRELPAARVQAPRALTLNRIFDFRQGRPQRKTKHVIGLGQSFGTGDLRAGRNLDLL